MGLQRWLMALLALALLALPAQGQQPRAGWPRDITIGSASIGGVYHLVAGGYVRIIQEKLGVPASNRVTGGPVHNLQLVHAKQIELGLTTMGPAYEAFRGIGWAAGTAHDSIRFTWPMYTSLGQWITREDSGIHSITDLAGRTVDLGPRGSSGEFVALKAFELFGIRPRRIVNQSFAEGANALRDGLVDANFGVIGVPVPAWLELSITRPVRIFGFTAEQVNRLTGEFPYLSPATIRANAYRRQDLAIPTVQMWNAAFVHRDMSDDFVYELTKTIFENQAALITVHPAGAETLPANVVYISLPLHPGAVRFYQERGLQLRPDQLPPRP